MFLKSLTLKGFKSFADTTTLELEPGITVVVGPNGSGKSNIVDAVAWVLGAQGPRTVRSGKMEDVIFAGTAKRSALGRAEVSLTIDNTAGLLPIEFSEVTLTRTLWRSGESEYAINQTPCRLLDLQELLSDSGVGRQQHVIVGQGQLDAVLNSQPTDRRLIIEEAAGVLKFRRRREKAQRRLESTEGNLLRVQDLLREVRRQMRPLERQAEAARRHDGVVVELSALRLFVAGRELTGLRTRAAAVASARTDQTASERTLVATLGRLDEDVLGAEAALSAAEGAVVREGVVSRPRRDLLADHVARAEGLRERTRGLIALVDERGRSLERMRSVEIDGDLIASLEGESADLVVALQAVETEAERLMPEVESLSEAEAELAELRATFEAESADPDSAEQAGGPDGPRPARASEVRGELSALHNAAERAGAERRRLDERRAALVAKAERVAAEAAQLERELAEAEGRASELVGRAEAAATALAAAESAAERAEQAFTVASGHHRSWAARAEALGQALDEARARAGAERLASVSGLVGTLLDVVDVDAGWEAAFEAAIGEAVAAVVVDDVGAARRALTHLHDERLGGAVLALGATPNTGQPGPEVSGGIGGDVGPLGGRPTPVYPPSVARPTPVYPPSVARPTPVYPPGVAAVRAHVRAVIPAVGVVLDRLLAGAVAVDGDWSEALDVACAHPELVVVTRAGDRFASAGWRAGAGGAGATGTAFEEARGRAAAAEVEVQRAAAERTATRQAVGAARAEETEAARAADRHASRRAQVTTALQRAQREGAEAAEELAAVAAHLSELVVRLQRDDVRISELEAVLPELDAQDAAGLERAAAERAQRGRLEQQAAALRTLRTDLEVRAAGLDERRTLLTRRRAEVEGRLERHLAERESAEQRRIELTAQFVAVERLGWQLAARATALDGALARLREERRAHAERTSALTGRLDDLRRARAAAERDLVATRERLQRANLEDAEVTVRIETATEAIRRDLDCEPEVAMAAGCPPLPPGTTAEHRLRELERDLRLMGPINPLALEEHAALVERHAFLENQLEDVKAGRRELSKVIRAIDAEIIDVFSAAYADVSENFTALFATLFPGGVGRLRLTDPDNLLDTGIEVEARPSGKNVKRLSLLSGGERSLTAMAFLFAVFRSRPSPFYLMDEVEAALDDVNLHRFLDLLSEFRAEAQLVIVSHQKRTMEAADCLYGVTMQPGGSSRVISERVGAGAS